MKAITDFLQKVIPESASSFHTEPDATKKKKKAAAAYAIATFRSRDADFGGIRDA